MKNPQTKIIGLALLASGLILFSYGLFIVLQPNQYEATTRIKIEPCVDDAGSLNPQPSDYDPYFIQVTFEIIQSEVVLGQVATNLNLADSWSKKYFDGKPAAASQIIRRIQSHMKLASVRGARLISVSFISDDPGETAQIANAVAEAYRNWREENRRHLLMEGVRALQKQYENDEKEIQSLQTNLNLLRLQLKISDDLTNWPPEQKPYRDTKEKLEQLKKLHKLFSIKIQGVKADNSLHQSPVQITDPATPPVSPIYPNCYLGGALLLAGLLLIGFGIFSCWD